MNPTVVFEDEAILVLEKPAGWIVNEAQTTKGQKVLQEWLEKKEYPLVKKKEFRSGIVHRLDKETSGLLIVAKTEKAFNYLQAQFKKRTIKKKYTALAHGEMEEEKGIISVPVGRLPWNKMRFGVLPGGRQAETRYEVEKEYEKEKNKYSLLTLYPKTGRTHQIRIHLKHLRHPIVSDEFYAGRKNARDDRKWCPRLFLHASGIEFTHPKTQKTVDLKSKLPNDLEASLKLLQE